ncbi:MAG: bifunctional (p)ppGpp synthetase/guanosine-3',5'-bis(diphosphate) 3'-pyrophosphohydrolase [Chloroflexi bacterium]|nr:bifunctional (p)ppGpp synthetase/guanosine-3',5'-bis(diphosphate) 3'-pyrophosphohydrolase [Chloroflexota bacterium]
MEAVATDHIEPEASREQAWLEGLLQRLSYLQEPDRELVRRAFYFAADAHRGQIRRSGEPYMIHPVATAQILADYHLEGAAIAAALLHDVLEDTSVRPEQLRVAFGNEIAVLVEGVTKLGRISLQVLEDSRRPNVKPREEDAQVWAENVRKMFLAMAEDIRVVLIKLADRLHNLRTLTYLAPSKRRQVAQETMEIYAPLASRLGIWDMKWQLEDLSFRHMDAERYKSIARQLAGTRASRERLVTQGMEILARELSRAGIKAEVSGRPKHIYSIHRKMERRGVGFDEIYDLLAVRVIVDTESDCYSALGIVHSLWHPIPGQFDDYIATPKESSYQSLHTTVVGPEGRPLEIQIRTLEMHRLAEYGVAAHWRYKEGGKRDVQFEEKIAWLRQLVDWQEDISGGAQRFVESLKSDFFRDQVYVFTPRGDIRELPAGATPIDFAYRIHTDVGHRCTGAKVNGRLVALDTPLKTGDIVEILTTKTPKGPSRDWLNASLGFVKTAHAQEKIRQWFRRQERGESIARGRELLERELSRLGLTGQKLEDLARLFKFDKVDDFFAAIGYGEISPQQIAVRTAEEEPERVTTAPAPSPGSGLATGIRVMGESNVLTRLAECCHPIPGDDIIGYVTRGRGITVHRKDCPNIITDVEKARLIRVEWGDGRGSPTYPVNVQIEAWDRDGLLRDIANIVAEDHVNMTSVSAISHPDHTATITATLQISSIDQLSRMLSKIERIRDISRVSRVRA